MKNDKQRFKLNVNKTIVLELNYHCNLQCIHCYIPGEEKKPKKYMSYQEAKMILDQIKAQGFRRIVFTGGEPMVNTDFEKIYSYAWEQGFVINLYTNATLMAGSKKELLLAKKPALIKVSLFGGDADSYKSVTGHDLFSLVYSNILLMKENGVNVMVKVPLLRQSNLMAIKGVQRDLADRGISTKIEIRILPRFDGDSKTLSFRYTPEEIIALGIDNQTRGIKKFEKIQESKQKKVRDINYCLYICQPFVISPECNLQLCFFMREWTVNLKDVPLVEAFEALVDKISNEPMINAALECENCDRQYMCPYCPGWAKTEIGMPNKKLPFLCDLVEGYEKKYNELVKDKC
ncbi:MAG: radical SAM protein [Lachnospiraceae bacterium]|nr:radical SAM protein [Lachnospiraceae bacterium]